MSIFRDKYNIKGLMETNTNTVIIKSPHSKLHGKKATIFHRHDNGNVNVQVTHSPKKGDVTNLTLKPDQFEYLKEGAKLPDWAQKEFDTAFKKNPKTANKTSDEWEPARHTAAEKETNLIKAKQQAAAELVAKVARKVTSRSYGKAVIDHKDEYPADMPERHPSFAGADHAMKAFGLTVRGVDAKKASLPVRPKGKAATPEAMAAYRRTLRRVVKEEVEVGVESDGTEANLKLKKNNKKDAPEKLETNEVETNTNKAKETFKEELNFELIAVKEGTSYYYNLSLDDEDVMEGVGITESGIVAEVLRKIEKLAVDK